MVTGELERELDKIDGFTADYQNMPITDEERQAAVAALQNVTPFSSAFQGAIGALMTSIVVGAITAIFVRRK